MNAMNGSLAGRTAIITGAGGGIGRATALALAARGANVVAAVRRGDTGVETVRLIEAGGSGAAASIQADCTDPAAMEAAVALAAGTFGGLDIMIHNAVYGHGAGVLPFAEITEDHMRKMIDVSLGGAQIAARVALPWLRRSDCARYIAMTSNFGLYATRVDAGYAAVKAGTRGLVKALAREWGPYGITANAISPAALSEGAEDFFAGNPGLQQEYYRKFPLGQIGRPREDIGEAIAGLCGRDFSYMTGQTIVLDGGMYTAL